MTIGNDFVPPKKKEVQIRLKNRFYIYFDTKANTQLSFV